MDQITEEYARRFGNLGAILSEIATHLEDYPGSSKAEKYLRNDLLRQQMSTIFRILRTDLSYNAADLRRTNRENMQLIGISEKEVMEFTDNLGEGGEFKEDELNIDDFDKPVPDIDSLNVQLSYARQIDSLRQAKKAGGK